MAVPISGGRICSEAAGVSPMRGVLTVATTADPNLRYVVFGSKLAGSPTDSKGNSYSLMASFGNCSIYLSGLIDTGAKALGVGDYIEVPVGSAAFVAHAFYKLAAIGSDGVETLSGSYTGGGSDFTLTDPGISSPACTDYLYLGLGVGKSSTGFITFSFVGVNAVTLVHGSTPAAIGADRYDTGLAYLTPQVGNVIKGHIANTFGASVSYEFLAVRWKSSDCPPPPPSDSYNSYEPYLVRDYTGQFLLYYIELDGSLAVRLYANNDVAYTALAVDADTTCADPNFYLRDGVIAGTYRRGSTGYTAFSFDHGRTYTVAAIPGTWDHLTSQEWKGRIVAFGYRASVPGWRCVVGKVTRDGAGNVSVAWGSETAVPTTSPTGKGHLREALDGELTLVYEGASGFTILSCRNVNLSGAGDFFTF